MWKRHFDRAFEFSAWASEQLRGVAIDACIVHDAYALAAGHRIRSEREAFLIYDGVEYPDYTGRSGHGFDAYREMPEGAFLCLAHDLAVIAECDSVFVGSPGVARWYEMQGGMAPVLVRNCLDYQDIPVDRTMRSDCGIGNDVSLIVYPNTVHRRSGFETLLEALRLLPDDVHLAVSGRLETGYGDQVAALVDQLGLRTRVHFLPLVSPERLVAYRSSADVAVIVLDPNNPNHYNSCPNRVFESVASRIPLVVPELPYIRELVDRFGCGSVFDRLEASSVAEAIRVVLGNSACFRERAETAARELSWDRERNHFVAALGTINAVGEARTIAYLADKSIVNHQRSFRHTRTLVEMGHRVIVLAREGPPAPALRVPGVTYHALDMVGTC